MGPIDGDQTVKKVKDAETAKKRPDIKIKKAKDSKKVKVKQKVDSKDVGSKTNFHEVSKSSLGSFKIPKSKSKQVEDRKRGKVDETSYKDPSLKDKLKVEKKREQRSDDFKKSSSEELKHGGEISKREGS